MNEGERLAAGRAERLEEFRGIVDAYQPQVLALALNILRNRQDAEDACQETFVQVYRHLAEYDSRRSLRTWIFMILHRRCLDVIRRKKRFRLFFVRAARATAPEAADSQPLSAGGFLSREILKSLRPKERAALALWANEGLTAAEIAAVMECAPSTARVHLFHARRKLQAFIEESKDHGTLGAR